MRCSLVCAPWGAGRKNSWRDWCASSPVVLMVIDFPLLAIFSSSPATSSSCFSVKWEGMSQKCCSIFVCLLTSYAAPLLVCRVKRSVPWENHFKCFLSVSVAVAVAPVGPAYSCLHIPDDEPVNHQWAGLWRWCFVLEWPYRLTSLLPVPLRISARTESEEALH